MSGSLVQGAGGVRLFVREEGAGEAVILLHGFPETHRTWDKIVPALAASGMRVLTPDMRGYGRSARPRDVAAYDLDLLADDVAALIRHAGGRAALVGHDWGGIVAWHVAMRHPNLLTKLVILNAPHPAWTARMRSLPRQWLRSWYIAFFQLPWIPELIARLLGPWLLRRLLNRDSRCAFDPAQLADYAVHARDAGPMIHYYRAWIRSKPWGKAYPRIDLPVFVLWGDRDRHLGTEVSGPDPAWAPDCVTLHADASHWIQNEKAGWVAAEILRFLRA